MAEERVDVVVAGAGIVGLAVARSILARRPCDLLVLEAEAEVAAHQTGHNSGVVHAGLYYAPGSLKQRLCVAGRQRLYRFCAEHDVPHERCGKVVVATDERQLPNLAALAERATQNGVIVERLAPEHLAVREPHVTSAAGALLVADTGIVDFGVMCRRLVELVTAAGGRVRTGCPVHGAAPDGPGLVVTTAAGEVRCRRLVTCAGLQADRVARRCGADPGVRLVPFRGEYGALRPEARSLVRHLVYPVPDPSLPFLGVHLTRGVDGEVEVGPSALLSLARHGYERGRIPPGQDVLDTLTWPGAWRLMARHWRSGIMEMRRAASHRALVTSARRLVPALADADVVPGRRGIRALALTRRGDIVDDFHIVADDRAVHVLNAPSPAATASLAIGDHVAELVPA
ncbi:MAG: L-2-hydroxyglutarate oxidase [Planctomycetota bacterium]|jgi:L-2-hydroxyglutarate oxidase